MKQLADIVIYFVIFLFFMLADLLLYYNYGKIHSIIPLVLTSALSVVVFAIMLMAVYEVIKHRNDKEEW